LILKTTIHQPSCKEIMSPRKVTLYNHTVTLLHWRSTVLVAVCFCLLACKKEPVSTITKLKSSDYIITSPEASTTYFLQELSKNLSNVSIITAKDSSPNIDYVLVSNPKLLKDYPNSPVINITPNNTKEPYLGANVLDAKYIWEIAEGTSKFLKENIATDDASKQLVEDKLTELRDYFLTLPYIAAAKTPPFIYVNSQFDSWISESGLPGTHIDLTSYSTSGSIDDTVQQILDSLSEKPKFIIWAKSPASEIEQAFIENGIDNRVIALNPEMGQSIMDCLHKNLLNLNPSNSSSELESIKITDFEDKIVPFIDKYCMFCHDLDTADGEVVFELYPGLLEAKMHPDLWEEAADLIEMGDMPPVKRRKQPSQEERDMFITWVESLTDKWNKGEMGLDPGYTTLRRLNRNEYNYTIRDLFGLKLRPADNFPVDASGKDGFNNNADALFLPPLLMENYVEAAGSIVDAIYQDPNLRKRYLFSSPTSNKSSEAARTILQTWAPKGYRKPISDDELNRLVEVFEINMKKEKSFSKAMRFPLLSMLISPHFIYRPETTQPNQDIYQIDDYDLANRLSYFIWSSMPDQELFSLAEERKLSDPEILEQQVIRMLEDEKSFTLGMHMGGQWFEWEALRNDANPDPKKYPMFTFDLRIAMYRESSVFFHKLAQENGSILELIDSDYTYVNELLARFYGISGVKGKDMQKVQLEDGNRGGVLGMASVLTATSGPQRTSPSVRGDWILTQLLGLV